MSAITEAEARALAEHIGIKLGLAKDGEEAPVETAARAILGWFAARPVLTEAAAREAVEAIVYVLGRSPFAMVRPLVALLVGRPAAGVRAPEALTEEAARAMVDKAIDAWGSDPDARLADLFTALLLRVAGPVTAGQAVEAPKP